MKKFIGFCLVMISMSTGLHAQDEEDAPAKGFKKENLFTGGSISLSFFNGQTIIGANPIFGYKLNDWIDAGLSLNFLYSGARDYYEYDDKMKQTVIGPGVFARIYPIPFLFLQGQFERNFSEFKYIPSTNNYQPYTQKINANSMLVGGGFASGRQKGSTSFFYISVLFDVMKDVNSPYVDVSYNPSNPLDYRVNVIPIIRAGVNVGLFQGRY